MFTIKIADLTIAIDNKFDYTESFCAKYIVSTDAVDFCVSVTQQEIDAERIALNSNATDEFIESICIYRNIANQLPKYDAFVIHCAAIEYNRKAYCFAAKSGTGKTTHIRLWRKTFGKNVNIINGDKPIIRFIDNIPYVYGTPWSGKENYNENVSYPLGCICFLNQAYENSIKRITVHEALGKFLHQVFIPKNDTKAATATVDMLSKLLLNTPIWLLDCNISEDAAVLAFNAITQEDEA